MIQEHVHGHRGGHGPTSVQSTHNILLRTFLLLSANPMGIAQF